MNQPKDTRNQTTSKTSKLSNKATSKKSTISVFKLFELYPDAESARVYFESRRWKDGVTCPFCGETSNITIRKGNAHGFYRCNACREDFTVRTGTIFERSHVPLHKWLYAMYMVLTARKGISSVQLAKELGVTQKTSWFMLHRIREACGSSSFSSSSSSCGSSEMLSGIVEVDETYVGGKEKNKHEYKKLHAGRGPVGKTPIVGLRERGGRLKAVVLGIGVVTGSATLEAIVKANVQRGAAVHTDEHAGYRCLAVDYKHAAINHGAREFSKNGVTTNGIESVWALFKRSVHGIHHYVSPKHTFRYIDETVFRLNDGNVRFSTLDRMSSLSDACFMTRITYKDLIA